MPRLLTLALVVGSTAWTTAVTAEPLPLRVATFRVDVTPPLGSPLCNGNVKPALKIATPLTARGLVMLGAKRPIVVCALDWVGIGNESHTAFRQALADAVATDIDRVAVHCLHQHDAPGSDLTAERILREHGLEGRFSNPEFDVAAIDRVARAARECLPRARPVTAIGLGAAKVERVASNRRILGDNGKVVLQRQSSGGRNPKARSAPEGTIDPLVRTAVFWNEETPLAALTWYATHPQSYYGQGEVNWDFVGIARELRETALPDVPHIHFNGASGNVAAGKYNDGAKENRLELARRLADGMRRAWESQHKQPLLAADVQWATQPVTLPVRDTLREDELLRKVADDSADVRARLRAARDLSFVRRMQAGPPITLACWKLGSASVLHMPGELFVEYQLAAQQLRPRDFVAMAAYGDYSPGYIGTAVAYGQGGYETGPVSRVAPTVERTLLTAVQELLEK
ncbi:MAG: hypothetical protein KDB14_32050 [Planctomycetales bacterium]|nr:hypothetical protein [Planctomycetales bacterium]